MRYTNHPITCLLFFLTLLCPLAVAAQPLRPPGTPPKVYDFVVRDRLAAQRSHFTQGLQIVDDTLYIGTGQYGESRLLEYRFPQMELLREIPLDDAFFGEGVTRFDNHLFQLTWRAGRLFVYDAQSLELQVSHPIPTEGWGITHDGHQLIYSDGSHRLYRLDPESLKRLGVIEVTLNGRPLPRLNELEWIDGEIWANVFMANQLVRINPGSGAVTGIVDLRGLLPAEERRNDTDVLNGIAWDARHQALWVTGKRWPWLYQIELRERGTSAGKTPRN